MLDRPLRGRTALLSPLDRLVFDRKRMTDLFAFDYQLEMYKPAAARRWGYWAMPVLHGDRLVGKLDATADPEGRVAAGRRAARGPAVVHYGARGRRPRDPRARRAARPRGPARLSPGSNPGCADPRAILTHPGEARRVRLLGARIRERYHSTAAAAPRQTTLAERNNANTGVWRARAEPPPAAGHVAGERQTEPAAGGGHRALEDVWAMAAGTPSPASASR